MNAFSPNVAAMPTAEFNSGGVLGVRAGRVPAAELVDVGEARRRQAGSGADGT
ncbi:hypothetical protein [Arthrobacter sp. H14-L1]|uniref:hypothetical protein n=1 Tax=Arthrobacter sp. H14-L1 TaxID=2996697 RepID=UPI00226EA8FC|nr:hypothetical protein [Arthrobacter sp. H14-L1]MCY0905863.1 hypothetical protein [Arthrobacter sp. H14-L1]